MKIAMYVEKLRLVDFMVKDFKSNIIDCFLMCGIPHKMFFYGVALSCVINIRNEDLIRAIGERVRELRILKGLTMEQLAANAGIEYRQISDVELGKTNPTISTLYAISSALDVTLPVLMSLKNF